MKCEFSQATMSSDLLTMLTQKNGPNCSGEKTVTKKKNAFLTLLTLGKTRTVCVFIVCHPLQHSTT